MVASGRLQGRAKIGVRVGSVINKYKVAKHFDYAIEDASLTFSPNAERIAAEAALDGLYVIRTSVAEGDMSAQAAVLNYKRLAEIERGFRTLKGVDLGVRPIRHRLEERVKAHILLSMLAYYVQWHMIQAWAPLTFMDEAAARCGARARPGGARHALAGGARQGAHPPAGRWHAGNELHPSAGPHGHHRAQHDALRERQDRRGHVHAHHATQSKAAASPRSSRHHRRVDRTEAAASISTD